MTRKAKKFAKQLYAKGFLRNEVNKLIELVRRSIFTYDFVLQAAMPTESIDRKYIKYYTRKGLYKRLIAFGYLDKEQLEFLIAFYDPVKRAAYILSNLQDNIFQMALSLSYEELKDIPEIKPGILPKFRREFEERIKPLVGVKILETESEVFYQEANGIRVCKK